MGAKRKSTSLKFKQKKKKEERSKFGFTCRGDESGPAA